jgi:ABC-2 type transport system permease protein
MSTIHHDTHHADRAMHAAIPLRRVVAVELRKSVDTRAGLWLLAGVGIASVLTTGAVILWGERSELTYATFARATSVPMSIILPVIAVLSVTAEWSQRSGLTTFTLVPHRGRVMTAKAIGAVTIAAVATFVGFVAAAAGNVLGSSIADAPLTWDQSPADVGYHTLSNVLFMLVGFTLAILIRNSPGAIVAYFIYAFVTPPLLMALAYKQTWFHDAQPWIDANDNQNALLDGAFTQQQWAQLTVTTVVWLLLPLAIGVRSLLRAEVK